MKYCTKCGEQIKDESVFCVYCGAQQIEVQQDTPVPSPVKMEAPSQAQTPAGAEKPATDDTYTKEQKEGGKNTPSKTIIIIAVAVIVVALGAVLYFKFLGNRGTSGVNETTVAVLETEVPGIREVVIKAPETKAAEIKVPETKATETKAPETKAAETKAPETKETTKAATTEAPTEAATAAFEPAVTVEMGEQTPSADGKGYFVIYKGLDACGKTVWEYKTGVNPYTQLNTTGLFGINDGKAYLTDNNALMVFELATGELLWENEQIVGGSPKGIFDGDGNLYICGYCDNDYKKVSKDGKVLYTSESFGDMLWPCKMEITGERFEISFDHISGMGSIIFNKESGKIYKVVSGFEGYWTDLWDVNLEYGYIIYPKNGEYIVSIDNQNNSEPGLYEYHCYLENSVLVAYEYYTEYYANGVLMKKTLSNVDARFRLTYYESEGVLYKDRINEPPYLQVDDFTDYSPIYDSYSSGVYTFIGATDINGNVIGYINNCQYKDFVLDNGTITFTETDGYGDSNRIQLTKCYGYLTQTITPSYQLDAYVFEGLYDDGSVLYLDYFPDAGFFRMTDGTTGDRNYFATPEGMYIKNIIGFY